MRAGIGWRIDSRLGDQNRIVVGQVHAYGQDAVHFELVNIYPNTDCREECARSNALLKITLENREDAINYET